ncbi:MAG: 1,2-phenylacetyl-CoA epoxidase subunit PaaD, partial [Aestuariivirgaceae bacterium]
QDIRSALDDAGLADARLTVTLSPPWTTDWMSDQGRANLKAFGIAPPQGKAGKRALFEDTGAIECPQCGSHDTELLSEFGSTACKALWRCQACREPFDHFKCI